MRGAQHAWKDFEQNQNKTELQLQPSTSDEEVRPGMDSAPSLLLTEERAAKLPHPTTEFLSSGLSTARRQEFYTA